MSFQVVLGVDTSVAVPLVVDRHPDHAMLDRWSRGRDLALCGHALVETYSVLTRLPGDLRLTAEDARTLLEERFVVPLVLHAEDALTVVERLASARVSGGATYDGLVALAALGNRVDLVTRDARARATYERIGVTVVIPS